MKGKKVDWNQQLFDAAMSGDEDKAKEALEKGAEIEAVDEEERTALAIAAQYGKVEIIKLLLGKGADINCKKASEPAIVKAAFYEKFNAMILLLDRGADIIQYKNPQGYGILAILAFHGKEESLKLLLKKRSDISNEEKTKALQRASENGHKAIILALFDDGVHPSDAAINIMFINAIQKNSLEFVTLWINKGASIEEADGMLSTAAQWKDGEILSVLIDTFQDRITNEQKTAALEVASKCGNTEVVNLLIKVYLDITEDKKNKFLEVCKKANAQAEYLNIVKKIFSNNPNVSYDEKIIFLYSAVNDGYQDVVKFLLENGADPFFRDQYNKTALDCAKDPEIKEMLLEYQKSMMLRYGLVSVVGLGIMAQFIPLEPIHAAGAFAVLAVGTSAMSANSNGLNSQVCSALSSSSVALTLYFVKSAIPEEYKITAKIVKFCTAVALYSTYNTLFPSMPEESKGQDQSI